MIVVILLEISHPVFLPRRPDPRPGRRHGREAARFARLPAGVGYPEPAAWRADTPATPSSASAAPSRRWSWRRPEPGAGDPARRCCDRSEPDVPALALIRPDARDASLPLARGVRGRGRIRRDCRVDGRDRRPRGRDRHDGRQQGHEDSDEEEALHEEGWDVRMGSSPPGNRRDARLIPDAARIPSRRP